MADFVICPACENNPVMDGKLCAVCLGHGVVPQTSIRNCFNTDSSCPDCHGAGWFQVNVPTFLHSMAPVGILPEHMVAIDGDLTPYGIPIIEGDRDQTYILPQQNMVADMLRQYMPTHLKPICELPPTVQVAREAVSIDDIPDDDLATVYPDHYCANTTLDRFCQYCYSRGVVFWSLAILVVQLLIILLLFVR